MRRAGASVAVVRAKRPRALPTMALGDLAYARNARVAASEGIEAHAPRAVVYSTTTAASLWPRPGAIRFDAPSAGNRPGRHGIWQRPVERRRLCEAALLLPWSEGGLAEAPCRHPDAVVVPVPVEPSGPAVAAKRDIAAITYAAHPEKKGLDRVLRAWRAVRRADETLVVAGVWGGSEGHGNGNGGGDDDDDDDDGVDYRGLLAPEDYRALLRRARIYVTAPRREDYGIAQLEALADGCVLVTTPAPGPYLAAPLARALDPRTVTDDLATAIRTALDDPVAGYAERGLSLLEPYRRATADVVVAERVLPALLSPSRSRPPAARRRPDAPL